MSKIKIEIDELEYQDYCAYKRILPEISGCLDREKHYIKQIEEQEKEINSLKESNQWYSIWHNKFQDKIKKLQEELETYRPTKLKGNGQCSCYNCEITNGFNRHWTDNCYKFKGQIYCAKCFKILFGGEFDEKRNQN